jgi:hypothetical protein
VKIDATITFEAADDTEGRRKLDAIAVITNCQVEDWTMEESWEGGPGHPRSQGSVRRRGHQPKAIRISEEDAEVCDQATIGVLGPLFAGHPVAVSV